MNDHSYEVGIGVLSLVPRTIMLGMILSACQSPEAASVADTGSARPTPSRGPLAAGTHYRLVAVDTLQLPDSTACGAPIATAGELTLRDNGTWISSERAQYSCARPASLVTDSGTFAWSGETLSLRSVVDPGVDGAGWGRGDTLRVDFGADAVYVYLRWPRVE